MEYDTKEAIEASLSSLKKFNELIKERLDAGYHRHERLHEFVVKGQWVLDTCGNCMKMEGGPRIMPSEVMTLDESRKLLVLWSAKFKSDIPSEEIICPVCKKTWTVKTMHDCRVESSNDKFLNGGDFIGKTLLQLKKYLKSLTDAEYYISSESNVKNIIYIDMTPDAKYPDTPVNRLGWINAKDDYVILRDDTISYYKRTYYHRDCLAKREELAAKALIKSKGRNYDHLFNLAGNENCNPFIKAELTICGIPIVPYEARGEVPAKFMGILNKFKFTRAWRYWVVEGEVPLSAANKMYADEVGSKYVRVAGHCGCPAPKDWAGTNDRGEQVVSTYHIDTLPGLKLFTKTIKETLVKG